MARIGTPPGREMPLAQPAFAALVVLDVPVGLPGPDLGQPEVELLDIRVVAELVRGAVEHDAPALHHVAVVGDAEVEGSVLLDEEHGELLLAVEPLNDLEDLLY